MKLNLARCRLLLLLMGLPQAALSCMAVMCSLSGVDTRDMIASRNGDRPLEGSPSQGNCVVR